MRASMLEALAARECAGGTSSASVRRMSVRCVQDEAGETCIRVRTEAGNGQRGNCCTGVAYGVPALM